MFLVREGKKKNTNAFALLTILLISGIMIVSVVAFRRFPFYLRVTRSGFPRGSDNSWILITAGGQKAAWKGLVS